MEGFDAASWGLYGDGLDDKGEVGDVDDPDLDFSLYVFCACASFVQLHLLALNTSGSLALVWCGYWAFFAGLNSSVIGRSPRDCNLLISAAFSLLHRRISAPHPMCGILQGRSLHGAQSIHSLFEPFDIPSSSKGGVKLTH